MQGSAAVEQFIHQVTEDMIEIAPGYSENDTVYGFKESVGLNLPKSLFWRIWLVSIFDMSELHEITIPGREEQIERGSMDIRLNQVFILNVELRMQCCF